MTFITSDDLLYNNIDLNGLYNTNDRLVLSQYMFWNSLKHWEFSEDSRKAKQLKFMNNF